MHEALREALANCLINTDFYGVRGVVIKKEPDKLIMENPGYSRTGKVQMRKGGVSDPRNKTLMKMFNLINIGERAGSGVPNIFNVWEDEGWVEPAIEEQFDPDRIILILEFKKKQAKKATVKSDSKKATEKNDRKKVTEKNDRKKVTKNTQLQYQQILTFMKLDTWYKASDLVEVLDVKETRTKELLRALVADGKILDNGATKGRCYKKL